MNKNFLGELNDSMMNDFVSVNQEKNPVARRSERLSPAQLAYVIGQYTIFPKNIVSFLLAARDRARSENLQDVAAELTRNMGEELGTETQGVTHYEMLLRGLMNELGSDTGSALRNTEASLATRQFVAGIQSALKEEKLAFVLGAIYAVESSAVPELRIVKSLADKLTSHLTSHGAIQDVYFNSFFAMHLGTWEPGHEEGLRAVSPAYLKNRTDKTLFEKGFKDVMAVMDRWWNGLAEEAARL